MDICKTVLKKLCEDLKEDINSPFCVDVQSHLQQCPQCRAYVSSIKNTVELCKKLIDEDVPHSIHDRLWSCLKLKDSE